jgi:hypothetical protein
MFISKKSRSQLNIYKPGEKITNFATSTSPIEAGAFPFLL